MEKRDIAVSKIAYVEDAHGNIDPKLHSLQISVKYETEPPRGDGIYSVRIREKKLPFWIYGRNLLLIGERHVLAECVQPNTFSPIISVCIDLKKESYASLHDWYTDIYLTERGMVFDNRYVKVKTKVLREWKDLEWLHW